MTKQPRYFGLWCERGPDHAPSIQETIDPSWHPIDFEKILNYLSDSRFLCVIPGAPNPCAICSFELRGSGWQTDGAWVWHSIVPHVVKEHHVRIPDEFLAHMRAKDFVLNDEEELDYDKLDWPFPRPV